MDRDNAQGGCDEVSTNLRVKRAVFVLFDRFYVSHTRAPPQRGLTTV